MRVMHVFSGRETGGIASVILPLLMELKGMEMEVMTVFLSDGPMVRMAESLGLAPRIIRRGHLMDVRLVARLTAMIRRERVRIVHTHGVSGNFYGRLAAFFARGAVTVTSVHADTMSELADATGSMMKARVWHGVDLYMARLSKLIIVNSESTGKLMIQKGVREEKLRVVYNGLDCSSRPAVDSAEVRRELGISEGARVVGSVGRLTATKNYPLFIKAARHVLDSEPDVFFLIVGDGPERSALEGMARGFGMENRFIITGWSEDVDRYLGIMDIFALTSLREGFGLVILEAMKYSLPVAATRVGGVPEVVEDGVTGFLVSSDDDAGLADKIMTLLADAPLCRRFGKNGRKRLEDKFGIEKMAASTRNVYIEAV